MQPDEIIEFPLDSWKGTPARTIKARWTISNNRYVELSVNHWPDRKQFSAIVLDHLQDGNIVTCMPMSATNVARQAVGRYSKKALKEFYSEVVSDPEVLAVVQSYKNNPTATER